MHSTGATIDPDAMRQIALFNNLEGPSVERIAGGGWTVRHPRGTRVLGRGEALNGLYAVFEGRLKLYMLSCNGDERILRILQPGDSFGEAIMFNAFPSPVYIETLSAVKLAYFPRKVVSRALATDPRFTTAMLNGMSRMMQELLIDLEACCLQNARQRTANYLLREVQQDTSGGDEVRLPAAKAVVASTLNISAETFSRELHRLRAMNLITIDRRTIHLRDRIGLQTLAEGGLLDEDRVKAQSAH